MTVELRRDSLTATLEGGAHLSVASLRAGPRELLLAPEALPVAYRVHSARAGITLLHPWANRLGATAFSVAGRALRVAPDDPLAAHDATGLSIHGLAHPEGWRIERVGPSAARALALWPELPAFPFAHRLEVRFELRAGNRLTVATTLAAIGPAPVPVAFGWHPYFAAADPVLSLPERRRLDLDARGLPTGGSVLEGASAGLQPEQTLDDSFDGLPDGATWELRSTGAGLAVRHDRAFPSAQLFVPRDAPVVSFEPMTAPVDGLRTGHGLRLARPEAPYSAVFTISLAG